MESYKKAKARNEKLMAKPRLYTEHFNTCMVFGLIPLTRVEYEELTEEKKGEIS